MYLGLFTVTWWVTVATAGVILLGIAIYAEDYHKIILFSVFFVLMFANYMNLLLIFAISKTDETTNAVDERSAKYKPPKNSAFKQYKVFYVLGFSISNIVFGLLLER